MQAAAPLGGMYVSHNCGEGNRLLESVDELLAIARQANAPAELCHRKAAGQANWLGMARVIAKEDPPRAAGARIVADRYT